MPVIWNLDELSSPPFLFIEMDNGTRALGPFLPESFENNEFKWSVVAPSGMTDFRGVIRMGHYVTKTPWQTITPGDTMTFLMSVSMPRVYQPS